VQTLFKIGAAAVKRRDADFIPLEVADCILGGSASSRLFLRVREKESNAYSVGSRLTETVDRGTWHVSGSTSTEATGEALASILDEIARIGSEEASTEEIQEALAFMTGSFALRIETTDQVAQHVSDLTLFGLARDYWDSYFDTLASVKAGEVRKKAGAVLDAGRLVVVLVGDAKKMKPLLKSYDNISIINP
jgi:zinc protease